MNVRPDSSKWKTGAIGKSADSFAETTFAPVNPVSSQSVAKTLVSRFRDIFAVPSGQKAFSSEHQGLCPGPTA
jgi:hypothetical protein